MTAQELLKAGKLAGALEAVTAQVKADPTDVPARTFLFELLCFTGDYDRARKQLELIAGDDQFTQLAVAAYRDLLDSLRHRRSVFAGQARPDVPTDCPAWVGELVDAVHLCAAGKASEATAKVAAAEAARPRVAGKAVIKATPGSSPDTHEMSFSDIRDGDDTVGPVLELLIRGGRYFWLPWSQVASYELTAPTKLRDLLFPQVRVQTKTGPVENAFLPALYAGSDASKDDAVRLGRITDWTDSSVGPVRGSGQRLYFLDDRDVPVLELLRVDATA